MKGIKFRGKRIGSGEWIYGVPIPNSFGNKVFMIRLILGDKIAYPPERLHDFCIEVVPGSVGQFTGLKDKNGVEIYERDILKNKKGKAGYVTYLQQEAGYVVVTKDSDYRLGHRNTNESYDQAQYHEVIGNIHDNPDLISN